MDNPAYVNQNDRKENNDHRNFKVPGKPRTIANTRKFAALASAKLNEQYFYEKECSKFCPKKDSKECQCGLLNIKHSPSALEEPHGTKWDSKTCTTQTKWRCYGTIRFKNQDTLHSGSPYMRVGDDVDVAKLVGQIHAKWKISKPSLIISVTGGASDFKMKKKDHDKLRQGLQRVAATKGAWVITGGTNAGIMKICGEAVRDHILSSVSGSDTRNQVVTIGIATWGAIPGYSEYLIPPENHDETKDYEAHYQKPLKGTGLDPNHTHFIFADDGSRGQFGKEQGLRGQFEKVVCENGVGRKGTNVPIVCVMVEGGPGTIDTARNALMNNTPCVVIDGSGRGADVLAYAVEMSNSKRLAELNDQDQKTELRRCIEPKAEKLLDLKGDRLNKIVDWLMECLEHKDKIRVFKFDEDDGESAGDLDKAILQTLLEMGGLDVRTQLELSLLWNRHDMADQILRKNKSSIDVRDLEEFLTKSLIDNKLEFVKIFVEMLSLNNFLTRAKLEELYNETLKTSSDKFLLETLESKEGKKDVSRRDLEHIQTALRIIKNIDYCPQYSMIERTEVSKEVASSIITKRKRRNNNNKIHQAQELTTQQSFSQTFRHPERELFVYSLLFIRPETSEYFWEDMLCKTSASLFAILVSKAILKSSAVRVDMNLQLKVEQMLNSYEAKAKGTLNTCYDINAKTCQTVLKVQHESWGKKTCLDLAEKADCKEFLAQSGCQTLVRQVWLGKLSDRNPLWKIALASFFPFLVYAIWFKADDSLERAELENERKRLIEDENDNPSDKRSIIRKDPVKGSSLQGDKPSVTSDTELVALETEDSLANLTKNRGQDLTLLFRYQHFYTAPIVTFVLNLASFVIFLILLSSVTLEGLKKTPNIQEYIVIGWITTLALEEIRQFIIITEPTFIKRVTVFFFENKWNAVDIIALVAFIPGLVMRMNEDWEQLNTAHGFYVVTLILYFIRFTSVFSMHNYLGPKIVMISKMLTDLGFFFCIALVYVVAYGIAVQSLIYPGISDPPFTVPYGIFFRPYFEMLGEPNMDEIGATKFDNCTAGSEAFWPYEDCPDERKTIFALCLKALYMLFTNVLLLNLLIAIFNNRYNDVNEQSNVYWKFQMFEVIKEYYNRPWLPPPFIIFAHGYSLFISVRRREMPKLRKLTEKPKDSKKLEKWEDIRAKEFASLTEKRAQEHIEERVRKIEGRSILIDKATCSIKGELQDLQKILQETAKSQKPSRDEVEDPKTLFERELTSIRGDNNDLSGRIRALETKLESHEETMSSQMSSVDERCQNIESLLRMLITSISRNEEPVQMVDLELER